MTLREELKRRTAGAHSQIELNPLLADLVRPSLTLAKYRLVIARYFGFFDALEKNWPPTEQVGTEIHWRSKALVADMQALDFTADEIAELPRCRDLPELSSSSVLGVRYVVEGSSLGGVMIAKSIQQNLHLGPEKLNFFLGHQEKTGVHWQNFLKELQHDDETHKLDLSANGYDKWAAGVAHCAEESFEKMDRWMAAR